jgi:hypothetical protein
MLYFQAEITSGADFITLFDFRILLLLRYRNYYKQKK